MPVRPVDMSTIVQQSATTAAQYAAQTGAPAAAQAQAEAAEPGRHARRQEAVQRGPKGEAQAVGERPADEQRGHSRSRRRPSGRAADDSAATGPAEPPPSDGKGRLFDVRV